MDDLQDAIEDAQYMSAVAEEALKPTKRWTYPAEDQVRRFVHRLEAHNADALGFDAVCAQCLGLYQLFQYCGGGGAAAPVEAPNPMGEGGGEGAKPQPEVPGAAALLMAFVAAVITYKRARSMLVRRERFIEIYDSFFDAGVEVTHPEAHEGELWRQPPKMTPAQVEAAYANTIDEERLERDGAGLKALPVNGALADKVRAAHAAVAGVDEARLATDAALQVEVHETLTGDLLDQIEAACCHYLKKHVYGGFRESRRFKRLMQFLYIQQRPVVEDDFALFRVLGRGGFGLVHGCKKCTSGKLYAMKVMNKRRIKARGSEKLCMNERRVLAEVDSPFIVCLKYAFATHDDLILILDLMTGGDLSFHLSLRGAAFSKREATFYAARTALALRHMHDLGIAYRDLKPENILMDEHGYTRLTDLGLACKVTPRGLSGVCGTRGYWAPEMIRRDPATKRRGTYDEKVDWWSYGCLLYEFVIGKCPFRTRAAKEWGGGDDRNRNIDAAILEMEPDFYGHQDEDLIDICRKLLVRDPEKRLGANGAKEVLSHPWFKKLDYHAVEANQVAPPMRPPKDINAASQSEIGAFQDAGSAKCELSEKDCRIYAEWGWTSPRAYQVEVIEYLDLEERCGGEEHVVREEANEAAASSNDDGGGLGIG
eukprot:CAMPEP_0118879884 /NCGR_PEP_ID=MMETSP1163-20130328/19561_1 /TAXON_ID=124430 /ORGANISM="Phaeomonas parva, Strain CCMP2877" /LENGTH=652 /DNA_ID=CAMNT_0006816131 /DNA_START=254 /DNA_END=2213 /DNA_ORIENTATION=-